MMVKTSKYLSTAFVTMILLSNAGQASQKGEEPLQKRTLNPSDFDAPFEYLPVKLEPIDLLDEEIPALPLITRDTIESVIKKFNPKFGSRRPDKNCLLCSVSFLNWVNTHTLLPATPTEPEEPNIIVRQQNALLLDQMAAEAIPGHTVEIVIDEDIEYIDVDANRVISFEPCTFGSLAQKMQQLPMKQADGGLFVTGLLSLGCLEIQSDKVKVDDVTDGHFLNFYIYEQDGIKKFLIVDPQTTDVRELTNFLNVAPKLYKDPPYIWWDRNGKPWGRLRPALKAEPEEAPSFSAIASPAIYSDNEHSSAPTWNKTTSRIKAEQAENGVEDQHYLPIPPSNYGETHTSERKREREPSVTLKEGHVNESKRALVLHEQERGAEQTIVNALPPIAEPPVLHTIFKTDVGHSDKGLQECSLITELYRDLLKNRGADVKESEMFLSAEIHYIMSTKTQNLEEKRGYLADAVSLIEKYFMKSTAVNCLLNRDLQFLIFQIITQVKSVGSNRSENLENLFGCLQNVFPDNPFWSIYDGSYMVASASTLMNTYMHAANAFSVAPSIDLQFQQMERMGCLADRLPRHGGLFAELLRNQKVLLEWAEKTYQSTQDEKKNQRITQLFGAIWAKLFDSQPKIGLAITVDDCRLMIQYADKLKIKESYYKKLMKFKNHVPTEIDMQLGDMIKRMKSENNN